MKPKAPSIVIVRSNAIAPDPRVEKIASALAQSGADVTALGWDRSGALPESEDRQAYRVQWIRLRGKPRRGLGNLPQLLAWQLYEWTWLMRHRRHYDMIHACDLDTVVMALLCKLFFGKQVVYDIFDFYADMLRRTPAATVRLVRWFELRLIGLADAVILADDARREQIAGSHPRRLAVIYNSPDEAAVSAPVRPALSVGLQIAYLGNVQRERGIFQLLEVVGQHADWHLDIGGFGPDCDEVRVRAEQAGNITWHGMVPYDQVLRLNAGADVLLATYDPSIPNNRYSSPNKVFEAMLLAKPIVVAENTNADRLVLSAGCGLAVPFGDAHALDQAFTRLAQNPALRAEMGQNGRRAYEDEYSWEKMRSRLTALYSQLRIEADQ